MTLAQLQHAVMASILDPDHQEIFTQVQPHAQLTEPQQLSIYRNNWREGLRKNLARTFPVCQRLVGEDFFAALTYAYLKAHSPKHYDMSWSGVDFATFIATFSATQTLPYLADVAHLEWAYQRAQEGPDCARLDGKAFAAMVANRPERIVFQLPENAYWLKSNYPIVRIWQVNQAEIDSGEEIDLNSGPHYVLVWRPYDQVCIELLTGNQWKFQQRLASGQTFAMIADTWEGAESEFIALLEIFIEKGWINRFMA